MNSGSKSTEEIVTHAQLLLDIWQEALSFIGRELQLSKSY